MTGLNQRVKRIWLCLLLLAVGWSLVSCGSRPGAPESRGEAGISAGRLTEVASPPVIQELRQSLEQYQPQVTILSPQSDEVVQDTSVSVQLQVQDLPLFKDQELQMGPHVHLILDNQPYQAVYSVEEPVVLEDLAPGTHTLRIFASRPWHESFKNEGAYAQTTFHIYTASDDNRPDAAKPLLTYSRPKGSYGAEPVMLDFYLTNAPLHLVAQENPDDEIADWRIRVTVNGESFFLDRWQPVYLKGFQSGTNWVQLEFLDEQGNTVKNAFNNTVRLITYQPQGQDTLSKLVRNELSAADARSIVDPNYEAELAPPPAPAIAPPEPEPTPEPEAPVPAEPLEELTEPEAPLEVPATELETIKELLESETPPEKFPGSVPPSLQEEVPAAEPEAGEEPAASQPESVPAEGIPPELESEPSPAEIPGEPEPKTTKPFQGILNRFRRPQISPSPSPEPLLPEVVDSEPEVIPEFEGVPEENDFSREESPELDELPAASDS